MTYQWRDLTGSVVGGKYTISDYLGDVGDTAVFATDAADGPAIARIAPAGRYATQWATAETLSHPHLVRTYASGTFEVDEDAFDYIVSERPEDSLSEAVQNRRLNADEARAVVQAILQASMYLHSQGLTHGAISPQNIVAIGDTIKLSPWTIARTGAPSDDMWQTGETIVEILTQQKPADVGQTRGLPEPFRRLAEGCLARRLSAAEALDILNGREVASSPGRRRKVPTAVLIGALVVVLLAVFWLRSSGSTTPSPVTTSDPVPTAPVDRPSPIDAEARGRIVESPPAKPTPSAAKTTPEGEWAVVGAIYNNYQGAVRRASRMRERARGFKPEVFPPEGQGRRYMVVLGYADTRKGAEQLRDRARAAGLPSDAYVTKIER